MQAVVKTRDFSLENDDKAYLQKTTHRQFTEHGELSWFLHSAFITSVFGERSYPDFYQKRNINTEAATNLLFKFVIIIHILNMDQHYVVYLTKIFLLFCGCLSFMVFIFFQDVNFSISCDFIWSFSGYFLY